MIPQRVAHFLGEHRQDRPTLDGQRGGDATITPCFPVLDPQLRVSANLFALVCPLTFEPRLLLLQRTVESETS